MNNPYPGIWMTCANSSSGSDRAARNTSGLHAMNTTDTTSVFRLPSFRHKAGNISAAGSSTAPMRNSATPRSPSPPPRS